MNHILDPALGDDTTDAGPALQDALDAATGGVVRIPGGAYRLAQRLNIDSHTRLELDPDAVIRRGGPLWGIQSRGDRTQPGHDQATGITITGGTWDGRRDVFDGPTANSNVITFRHCTDVTVTDTRLVHLGGAFHPIEFNAVRGGRAERVTVEDFPGTSDPARPNHAEAIQIDLASGTGTGTGTPWDNTPCTDIRIHDCTFTGVRRGVGSHTQIPGSPHRDITITGCRFEDVSGECVAAWNWSGVKVADCAARDVATFLVAPPPADVCRDWSVTGNSVENDPVIPGRGIWLRGGSVTDRRMLDAIITGNRLAGVGRVGISLDYLSSFVVAGNIVRDSGRDDPAGGVGISVYRTVHGVVADNRLNGNGADIQIGAADGAPTDTQSVLVHDNRLQRLLLGACDATGVHDNLISVGLTYSGAQTGLRLHDNQIRGAW